MTPKMRVVLNIIRAAIEKDGVAPTYAEIAEQIGCRSKSEVHRVIRSLEDLGMIDREPGRARAIYLPGSRPTRSADAAALSAVYQVREIIGKRRRGEIAPLTALDRIENVVAGVKA